MSGRNDCWFKLLARPWGWLRKRGVVLLLNLAVGPVAGSHAKRAILDGKSYDWRLSDFLDPVRFYPPEVDGTCKGFAVEDNVIATPFAPECI